MAHTVKLMPGVLKLFIQTCQPVPAGSGICEAMVSANVPSTPPPTTTPLGHDVSPNDCCPGGAEKDCDTTLNVALGRWTHTAYAVNVELLVLWLVTATVHFFAPSGYE